MWKFLALVIILTVPLLYYISTQNGSVASFFLGTEQGTYTIYVGDVPVVAEVADTPSTRAEGLSGRDRLSANNGLLFIFGESDYHGIWMKDMRFPIDVIWISEELRVVDVRADLLPSTFPRVFEPREPARFVLEVPANFAESFGIVVGDSVSLPRELVPDDVR